jgi:hypothetical protein
MRPYINQEAVTEMDPERIATDIIPRIREKHRKGSAPVYLSIPSILSEFHWQGGNFEVLMEKFLDHVLETRHPAKSIRVALREKRRMADLEGFFSISPLYWLELSVEGQSTTRFEDGAKRILRDLGYCCPEWIGVEGSESQLGAFYFGTQETPALILFIQIHGAHRNCDFLIPVIESVPRLAYAV